MSFLEIKWLLPAALIAVGAIVLLVVWVFFRRGQLALKLIDDIYDLNLAVEHDLLDFLARLAPVLQRLEDFAGLSYQLDWYGQPVSAQVGKTARHPQLVELETEDVTLSLTLYWRRKRPGERWIFQEVLVRTLTVLMRMDLLLKQQTQSRAQQQAARSVLFLSHDIKNLAQFVQLQQDFLKRFPRESEDKNLKRLIRASGLAQQQASDILMKLDMPDSSGGLLANDEINLAEFCFKKAEAFGLKLELSGSAELFFPASVLDAVLENIYGNALEHGKVDQLKLDIESASGPVLRFIQSTPISEQLLQRVFEPLVSQTGENGRGIGMYQCRALLKKYNASIDAFNNPQSQAVIVIFFTPPEVV